jgi:hypothetical protein
VTKRALALAGLWALLSGAALFAPGCYGRNCEGDLITFGADTAQGRMIDENTWESSPMDGEWLAFPRQRYYVFSIPQLGGRIPSEPIGYVSAQQTPGKAFGGNFTIGSGNLVEFTNPLPNRIDVINDTCSDYFIRIVVKVPPNPPALTDGGTSLANVVDASPSDAGVDARADASP